MNKFSKEISVILAIIFLIALFFVFSDFAIFKPKEMPENTDIEVSSSSKIVGNTVDKQVSAEKDIENQVVAASKIVRNKEKILFSFIRLEKAVDNSQNYLAELLNFKAMLDDISKSKLSAPLTKLDKYKESNTIDIFKLIDEFEQNYHDIIDLEEENTLKNQSKSNTSKFFSNFIHVELVGEKAEEDNGANGLVFRAFKELKEGNLKRSYTILLDLSEETRNYYEDLLAMFKEKIEIKESMAEIYSYLQSLEVSSND